VYTIEQFARHCAALTTVHLVVAKGPSRPVPGVSVHGAEDYERRALPRADALLVPADLRDGYELLGLAADRGRPIVFLQGYGTPGDPYVSYNLELADTVLAGSGWLADEAVRAGCRANLIRYGLDRGIFQPGPPTEGRSDVVAMMTSPMTWKGTADGLAALARVREAHRGVTVKLFGSEDPGDPQAEFLAAPPAQRPQIAALMREAAVLVCPSWEEGFGLPGVEATLSGAALATTDTKGGRDYAFHDRTALVSAPRDPEALAANVLALLRDVALRRRLLEEGLATVDRLYPPWPQAAAGFVAAVEEAVDWASAVGPRQDTGAPVG
jgi:hypothetical protein